MSKLCLPAVLARTDYARSGPDKPQLRADLLLRALPYLLFCRVVSFEANTSELAKDGLPSEEQYNEAICTTLEDMKYQPVSTKKSRKGERNPDIALNIDEERFVLEGVKFTGKINEHLRRFKSKTNYKNAKHKGLYIIGNDKEKMLDTVKSTEADDVQVIGLVPNIAHTAYTVHVKSKGINSINTFNVDCDLVARRLVLKDNGKPELYSVQSLKSVKLSPTAQPSRWVKQFSFALGLRKRPDFSMQTDLSLSSLCLARYKRHYVNASFLLGETTS